MIRFPVPEPVKIFSRRFTQEGHQLFIVGGAVRDHLLGRPSSDFDFATDATPDEVSALFRTVIPTGIKHGTVTVLYRKESFEVTTFRIDGEYRDNRHPESVEFVRSLEQDLSRRDFTVNALAVDVSNGVVIDLHGGLQDLSTRTLRAIGDAEHRFTEDSLRILRACRFACQLDFHIEAATFAAMVKLAHNLSKVSGERVRTELEKILGARVPSVGFESMRACGALAVLLPELQACLGIDQGGFHRLDVYRHSLAACDHAPPGNLPLRWAALLHDVGKPAVKQEHGADRPTFHRHEAVSVNLALAIFERLKCSNEEKSKVTNLIANHMFHYGNDWSDGAVRRFINKVGLEALDDLFALRLADQLATTGSSDYSVLAELKRRIETVVQSGSALTVKDLAVNGNDLYAAGIPKDRTMGIVLQELLDTVLDDPSQNTRERLLNIALSYYKERIDLR